MLIRPVRRKKTSLERPDQPHGKVLRLRASRGHVSDWLLPSRREAKAARVFLRLRGLMLGFTVFGIGVARAAPAPVHLVLLACSVWWGVAAALPGRGAAWFRITPPAVALLGIAADGLVGSGRHLSAFTPNASLVIALMALLAAWHALRIDAVSRAPLRVPRGAGTRERVQLLRTNRAFDLITTVAALVGLALLLWTLVSDAR